MTAHRQQTTQGHTETHRCTQRDTHIHGTGGQLLMWCVVLTDCPPSPWHPHCFVILFLIKWGWPVNQAWHEAEVMQGRFQQQPPACPFLSGEAICYSMRKPNTPERPCLPLVSLPHAMQHRSRLAAAAWASALAVLPSSSCLKRGRRTGTRQRDALDLGRSGVLAVTPQNAT